MARVKKLAALLVVATFGLAAFAQQTDPLFAAAAAQSDIYEITAAKIALDHTNSQAVKAFAQKMIHDHSETTAHLKPIAKAMGITPPTETNAAAKLELSYLKTLNGQAFDSAYSKQQVVSHEAAVGAFEIATKTAQNSELKAFAKKYLPVIQGHLKMAQQLAK